LASKGYESGLEQQISVDVIPLQQPHSAAHGVLKLETLEEMLCSWQWSNRMQSSVKNPSENLHMETRRKTELPDRGREAGEQKRITKARSRRDPGSRIAEGFGISECDSR
jgi:hypothetical protein